MVNLGFFERELKVKTALSIEKPFQQKVSRQFMAFMARICKVPSQEEALPDSVFNN